MLNQLIFLDVTIIGDEGRVIAKQLRKPFTPNSLLRADSGHPKHTIRGILVGQFLRLERICSDDEDFQKGSPTYETTV